MRMPAACAIRPGSAAAAHSASHRGECGVASKTCFALSGDFSASDSLRLWNGNAEPHQALGW